MLTSSFSQLFDFFFSYIFLFLFLFFCVPYAVSPRQRFFGVCLQLIESLDLRAENVPEVIRTVLSMLRQIVETLFPNSGPCTVGGFFFLRFLCPCISLFILTFPSLFVDFLKPLLLLLLNSVGFSRDSKDNRGAPKTKIEGCTDKCEQSAPVFE